MSTQVPQHVGIVMDGNRRWARAKGLVELEGHMEGVNTAESIARHAFERGVQYLTLFAFSTENWNRSKEEVDGLMAIFREGFDDHFMRLIEEDICIRFIGSREGLAQDIKVRMDRIARDSSGKNHTLMIALNYGGRGEIVQAFKDIAERGIKNITEQTISQFLYTPGIPDPELIIRPGGMPRLSGFMPWQSAYANLKFTDTLWPDFTTQEFDKILKWNEKYTQNFGS